MAGSTGNGADQRNGTAPIARTIAETVAMGVAAAIAGVAIGLLIDRSVGG